MTATRPEVASCVCQSTLRLANCGGVTDIAKAGGELLRRLAVANRKPRSFRCTAFRLACAVFVTEARLDALNAALAAHGVDATRIISIFQLPGQPVANSLPARFQVLYRKR